MKNKLLSTAFVFGMLFINTTNAAEVEVKKNTKPQKNFKIQKDKGVTSEAYKINMEEVVYFEAFKEMDFNKDGLISKCESKTFLKMDFNRMDLNKDCILDEAEFSKKRFGMMNYQMLDMKEINKNNIAIKNRAMPKNSMNMMSINSMFTMLPAREEFFAKLDKNNNGIISKKEFIKEGNMAFKMMDIDEDGKLSLSEFSPKQMDNYIKYKQK